LVFCNSYPTAFELRNNSYIAQFHQYHIIFSLHYSMQVVQFLLLIIIIKLILLKIRVRIVKFQIYEWQRATVNSVFRPNPTQVRWKGAACFVYIRSKRATDSDVFHKNNTTRQ
jgi:hypothetical protein